MTRAEQLADAYEAVASADHYMVGIVETVTDDELGDAQQILITRQNALTDESGEAFKVLELALDLIEQEQRSRLVAASRGA